MPQVQYLLEVCQLEVADFIQYKPASVFGVEEFVVVRVYKNHRWFPVYRPVIQEFISILTYFLSNKEALGMLREEYNPWVSTFKLMPLYAELWETSTKSPEIDYCKNNKS